MCIRDRSNSILEEEANLPLFSYLEAGLQWLDTHDKIANFHIFFLLNLTRYLGFYPDTSHIQESSFDLLEGGFTNTVSGNPSINGKILAHFKTFLGTNFDAIHTITMVKNDRQDLLQSVVLYFELHLHGFRKPKSLTILNEVFS